MQKPQQFTVFKPFSNSTITKFRKAESSIFIVFVRYDIFCLLQEFIVIFICIHPYKFINYEPKAKSGMAAWRQK